MYIDQIFNRGSVCKTLRGRLPFSPKPVKRASKVMSFSDPAVSELYTELYIVHRGAIPIKSDYISADMHTLTSGVIAGAVVISRAANLGRPRLENGRKRQ